MTTCVFRHLGLGLRRSFGPAAKSAIFAPKMGEKSPGHGWFSKNLAPAGKRQEEKARLIASPNFGECARQFLERSLNHTSPTTIPDETELPETTVARTQTTRENPLNPLPGSSRTIRSDTTKNPRIPEKHKRSIDLGREKKRKKLRDEARDEPPIGSDHTPNGGVH